LEVNSEEPAMIVFATLRRLRVSTKLAGAVGAALVALCVMGAIAVFAAKQIQGLGHDLYAENDRLSNIEMNVSLAIERAIGNVHSAPAELDLVQLKAKRESFEALLGDAEKILQQPLPAGTAGDVKTAQTKVAAATVAFEAASKKVFELTAAFAQPDAIAVLSEQVAPAEAVLQASLKEFHDAAVRSSAAKEDAIGTTTTTIGWVVIGLAVFLVVSIAALAYATVARGVVRPIGSLNRVMIQLSSGDASVEIPYAARFDEIGDMAKAVQVFKSNMIEKRKLEERNMREQTARARRQEEIDQLVGFFGHSVGGVFDALATVSTDMARTSSSLETSATDTSQQSRLVLDEVGQTSATVQTVAAAAQELSASIDEIGRQASESSRIASAAMQQTDDVVGKVAGLREAAQQIGAVVELINNIAAQTNLLALNATIEAARAGDAGKGFAVVAGEVKSLANQTAKATEEIGGQVAAIQAATLGAAEAIKGIAGTVREVNDIAVSIAAAVVEQGSATQEITRSVELVSSSTANVAQSMTRVSDAVTSNGGSVTEVKRTAETLSAEAETLSSEVKDFIAALRGLGGGQSLHSLELDAEATATVDGRGIAGRVRKLSPGFALFAGPLAVAPGTLLELRIAGIDRKLPARFVEAGDGGIYLQLPLNHEHLSYMGQALTRLGMAAAA
jgi:methyl-accepting chemotaxis protein